MERERERETLCVCARAGVTKNKVGSGVKGVISRQKGRKVCVVCMYNVCMCINVCKNKCSYLTVGNWLEWPVACRLAPLLIMPPAIFLLLYILLNKYLYF